MLDPRQLAREIAAMSAARRGDGQSFQGTWRLISMERWRQDMVDMCGPGHVVFREGFGQLRFCAVQADLDCHHSTRDRKPHVEFSWSGRDDQRATSGRGWATLDAPDRLHGRIFFHRGDDSAFEAVRQELPAPAPTSGSASARADRRSVLRRLEQEDEVAAAQDIFVMELRRRAARSGPVALGWRGGGDTCPALWFEPQDIWAAFNEHEGRYWNGFGVGNPFEDPAARTLVVEVNPPRWGVDRRCAGAFLTGVGGLHLAHSGRVGGGRKGIGRESFLRAYTGPIVEVATTSTRTERLIHVTPLAAPDIVDRLAAFIRAVDSFKRQAVPPSSDAG